MPDRDLEALMERIRAEAAALRRAAREADIELTTMAAKARRKRRQQLSREANSSRSGEGAGGEDRQLGVEPNQPAAPDAERWAVSSAADPYCEQLARFHEKLAEAWELLGRSDQAAYERDRAARLRCAPPGQPEPQPERG